MDITDEALGTEHVIIDPNGKIVKVFTVSSLRPQRRVLALWISATWIRVSFTSSKATAILNESRVNFEWDIEGGYG